MNSSLSNTIRLTVWLLAATLLFISIAAASRPATADIQTDDDPYITDQLVAKLDPASGATIDDINADYNTTTLDVILQSAGIYLLQTAPGDDAHDVAQLMDPSGSGGGDDRIEYAEANYLSDLPEGNPQDVWAWGGTDPSPIGTQYAPELINLAQAHLAGQMGNGVTVAVIDSGFTFDHPFLQGMWTTARYDFIDDDDQPDEAPNGLDDDNDGQIDEAVGHGTHVAGIVHQVAPMARLMPIRALDSDGRSNLFLLAEAIEFALDNGADVVNLSLGTGYDSDLLVDTLERLGPADAVIVAAAGNLGTTTEQYPAAYPQALGVTAVDENKVKAPSATYGAWVDVAAPGVSIFSSFPPDGYAWWSGTSMATPFVAGQAALLRGIDPTLTIADVQSIIATTAQNIDAENPGFGGLLGAGLLDVGAAVASIVPPGDVLFLSSGSSTTVGGFGVDSADIFGYTTATESWFPYFDGGLRGVGSADIDAFLLYQGNRLILSFANPTSVPGVGTVDDSDLVLYTPSTDTFLLALDGSDVGLTTDDEDIDAIAIVSGKLAVSTSGAFTVNGLSGEDEDIMLLNSATFGANSSGTWSLYFDGSDVGLGGSAARDIVALWHDNAANALYFTTAGTFMALGNSVTPSDVALCALTGTGSNSGCSPVQSRLFWRGAPLGLSTAINALYVRPAGSSVPRLDGFTGLAP